MIIVGLKSENVKRLKAINIKPNGSKVIIGGRNGQGKSSALDSIAYALGGMGLVPDMPIRTGQKKAKIDVDLGDYKVTRTFTATGGGNLKIKGHKGGSPQKLLTSFTGKLTFDPLKWSEMDTKDQLETLKGLIGLDFTDLDSDRKGFYDRRTAENRELKELKIKLAEIKPGDISLKHENISKLVKEIEAGTKLNMENGKKLEILAEKEALIPRIEREIESLQKQIEEKKRYCEEIVAKVAKMKTLAVKLEDVDLSSLRERLGRAEENNSIVARNAARKDLEERIENTAAEVEALGNHISDIDDKKEVMLSEASFPIEGLSFDEDGVMYGGIPFNQCSTAEKLRVSVAMGFAMNPELKILLIRDGSHLDDDSLAMVCQMAEENNGQVWIERVGKGDECSVIIEDGEIESGGVEQEPEPEPEPVVAEEPEPKSEIKPEDEEVW